MRSDTLPDYFYEFLRRMGIKEEAIERELSDPVPALNDKSIAQAYAEGDFEGVYQVLLRWAEALDADDSADGLLKDLRAKLNR